MNYKKLLTMLVVGGIILGGLYMRDTGPEVKDIDPEVLEKGQVKLVDVMEAPIIVGDNYQEPEHFNCVTLREKFLHTKVSQLGKISTEKIKQAHCDKVLKKFNDSKIVRKLIACLNEDERSNECADYLIYFRAFSIENLLKRQPELIKENDNVKLHKIVWELATTSEYKVNEMEDLIARIDGLLAKHPYLYALHKAKLIYVVIKDVLYGDKIIDDRMYKTWEMMTDLREDTRDNWELRFMNVLHHKVFFEPKDMKDWADTFLLDYPEYYMSYFYYAYFYWEIKEDKYQAIEWLQAGIDKTGDPNGKLQKTLKRVKSSKVGSKVFDFNFDFEIIHD